MDANDAAGRLAVVWALLKQDDPEGTDELTRAVETTALRQIAQVRAEDLKRKDDLIRELAEALEECRTHAQTFARMTTNEDSANEARAACRRGADALRKAGRL